MTNQQMWEEILVKLGVEHSPGINNLGIYPPPTLDNLFSIGVKFATEQGYHVSTESYARKLDGVWGKCSWVTIEKEGVIEIAFQGATLNPILLKALHKALE